MSGKTSGRDEKNSILPNLFKRHGVDKISDALLLPVDTLRNFPTVQIRGNRETVVEGCRGLLSYERECVLLETKFCVIEIQGRELILRTLAAGMLSIKGYISKVEFKMSK